MPPDPASEEEEIQPLPRAVTARGLAEAWLAGAWTRAAMRERTERLLDTNALDTQQEELVLGFWRLLRDRPHARTERRLTRTLLDSQLFDDVAARIENIEPLPDRPTMSPGVRAWPVPPLPHPGAVAAWLSVTPEELVHLADRHGIARHYHRYWRGARLIEAPLPRLKAAQRRIAREVLAHIPVHDAAHGFRPRRGVLSAVRPHAGKPVVFVADLRAFFPSLGSGRVHGLLQAAGYPEPTAHVLTDLCTSRCRTLPPRTDGATVDHMERQRLRQRHVPPGAPTSPALANLVCYRLDARLAGLAAAAGARYTRYADDLIFSGPRSLARARFARGVARIAADEGFELHPDKTRAMTQSVRQQVLGIVLNDRPTLPRSELDGLEGWLHNCVRDGADAHNRDGIPHLREQLSGRVAWAMHIDPRRARRLAELLAAVRW